VVTVDENIPIKDGKPLMAQPNGRELWVAMLEKAFAKFCGGYTDLDGGLCSWAFTTLTGDPVFTLRKEGEAWRRMNLKVKKHSGNKRDMGMYKSEETHPNAEVFFLLRKYTKNRALIGASFQPGAPGSGSGLNGEQMGPKGLVAGHAYSVLDAKSFKDSNAPGGRLKLIQLRNPWGKYEWKGAWSDGSAEWTAYPHVVKIIKPVDGDDGSFWMSWEDFSVIFQSLDICSRSTGLRDCHLDVKEADGAANCAGPCQGCCEGCASWWCGCKGCVALYCDTKASTQTYTVDEKGRDDDLLQVLTSSMERN